MSLYPFIVAEMGANHMDSLERAKDICTEAKRAGADAIKLQTYTADCMVLKGVRHPILEGPWAGMDMWDLYERGSLKWSWHMPIFEHCRQIALPCFSTPFSPDAIDLLERLECPMYKIASFEILDVELIRKAASTGKPLVISTGMASLAEINEAVETARRAGCTDLTLLKCTSAYPAPAREANLAMMREMHLHFDCKVGLSDHTKGSAVAVSAAMLGATMIEKHFTIPLDPRQARTAEPDKPYLDAGFSAGPDEFHQLVHDIRSAIDAIGTNEHYGPTASESSSLALRRTLHITRDLDEGESISIEKVAALRPGDGLPPAAFSSIAGLPVRRAVKRGEPLTWDLVRK